MVGDGVADGLLQSFAEMDEIRVRRDNPVCCPCTVAVAFCHVMQPKMPTNSEAINLISAWNLNK